MRGGGGGSGGQKAIRGHSSVAGASRYKGGAGSLVGQGIGGKRCECQSLPAVCPSQAQNHVDSVIDGDVLKTIQVLGIPSFTLTPAGADK